jgi:hypothetical protein
MCVQVFAALGEIVLLQLQFQLFPMLEEAVAVNEYPHKRHKPVPVSFFQAQIAGKSWKGFEISIAAW